MSIEAQKLNKGRGQVLQVHPSGGLPLQISASGVDAACPNSQLFHELGHISSLSRHLPVAAILNKIVFSLFTKCFSSSNLRLWHTIWPICPKTNLQVNMVIDYFYITHSFTRATQLQLLQLHPPKFHQQQRRQRHRQQYRQQRRQRYHQQHLQQLHHQQHLQQHRQQHRHHLRLSQLLQLLMLPFRLTLLFLLPLSIFSWMLEISLIISFLSSCREDPLSQAPSMSCQVFLSLQQLLHHRDCQRLFTWLPELLSSYLTIVYAACSTRVLVDYNP